MILFIVELFPNLRCFGFYIEQSSEYQNLWRIFRVIFNSKTKQKNPIFVCSVLFQNYETYLGL